MPTAPFRNARGERETPDASDEEIIIAVSDEEFDGVSDDIADSSSSDDGEEPLPPVYKLRCGTCENVYASL